MKKIILLCGFFACLFSFHPSYGHKESILVKEQNIHQGYIVEKVWLSNYALPQVLISEVGYINNVALPKDAKMSSPQQFEVILGMERKRPFAVVRIPAYSTGAQGTTSKVNSFVLTVNETAPTKMNVAAKTTDVTTSVLATGTWYKIGVTKTGFYKIDNNFITSMGLTPSAINPGNIRVFGNGGNMLSEDNSKPRPNDLIENATILNSNGDGAFDNSESLVFYAVGPTGWGKDSATQSFYHFNNLYSDTAYYFITFDQGAGKHVTTQPALPAGNIDVNTYDFYDVHDADLVSPAGIGKLWFGEQFSTQLSSTVQTFTFDLGTYVSTAYCRGSFGCTSDLAGSKFVIYMNGADMGAATFSTATKGDDLMTLSTTAARPGVCNSQIANIQLEFVPKDASSIGYLNFLEISARAELRINTDQMNFRDWRSVGAGNNANFQLQNGTGNTKVYDVTNPQVPVQMSGNLNGSTYVFTQDATTLHEFAAMNSNNLYTPKYAGTVINQNLHGAGPADLIIVTNPAFTAEAQRLADYHSSHDNMRVAVATTEQIYNEFSSGSQDISAIRDFARMFYKRAGSDVSQMPKNMILFGGGSYDYKNRLKNNCNFVPVFESAESLNDLSTFSSDDFYGFLDDSEYIENNTLLNVLDIGVGRLPARSVSDATSLVDKIIGYTQPNTLGPWRLSSMYVADDNDQAGNHMEDAEVMAGTVTASSEGLYNHGKVYLDALPKTPTPAGERCPSANAAINQHIFKGTFAINYNGHGNTQVWAGERILTNDDYNNWNNENSLPFMITATCDYGEFHNPLFVSAAEQLVIRRGGGVIAILTTTQAVFAVYNRPINVQYLDAQFTRNADGSWNTFGEANRIAKNTTYIVTHEAGQLANFRKFALLGDPALTPAFPKYNIQLDNVMDGTTQVHADSINALGKYVMSGSVRDLSGNILNDFNGQVFITFFDKPRKITTITSANASFNVQDNIVYKGKVSVTNGKFAFTFITPKDINYYFGTGKLSMYADNGITDAAGADTSLTVGGYSDNPIISTTPPVVKPYINDTLFLNGGITGSNTSLYVSLFSETGINVSGNKIGHDLTAILDNNLETPYMMNDYYETEPNTYQRGFVRFPVSGLSNGKHKITVKAWDVNNNVGEGTVEFIVVDNNIMAVETLMNYPNPFNDKTHFVFEHNHPDELLDVNITIYGMSGAVVHEIKRSFTPSGSRSSDITWDGTDKNGSRLPSGVYAYRLTITSEKGFKSSAYQKLVIVR